MMKTQKIFSSFTGKSITKYSGLSPINDFLKKTGFLTQLEQKFPTKFTNSTKFEDSQVLLSQIFASLSGINRLDKITNFTLDPLVQKLLGFEKHFNKNLISQRLKVFSKSRAIKLKKSLSEFCIKNSKLSKKLALDCDSTVSNASSNQEGAEKGYGPSLSFLSETKNLNNREIL